jgi:hypothetical protein
MNACALCGTRLSNPSQLCTHHMHTGDPEWAWINRRMCDFLHRAILPAPTTEMHEDEHPRWRWQEVA